MVFLWSANSSPRGFLVFKKPKPSSSAQTREIIQGPRCSCHTKKREREREREREEKEREKKKEKMAKLM
jgi:hypothetical protein